MLTSRSAPALPLIHHGPLAALTLLLDADERHKRIGKPLLTDHGACYIRQIIASLRSGRDAPESLTLPYWDQEQLQLWLGGRVLATFGHRQSYMSMILGGFQQAGWARRHIPNPLPRLRDESDVEAQKRLHSSLKNLNRELPTGTIRFVAEATGAKVRWNFCAADLPESSRFDSQLAERRKLHRI